MNLKLISCEIFYREMEAVAARSPHTIDITWLAKGLHDLPPGDMPPKVQEAIDAVPAGEFDAILLGYGLCNNGLAGVTARDCPLILPRAHDCITLFLGSRKRYREIFDRLPGTYFLTSGWIERGETSGELADLSVQSQLGMSLSMEELVEQYGKDNAEYLYETLCRGTKNYGRVLWIPMGVEPAGMKQTARSKAAEKKWEFETEPGDMRLIDALLAGDWNDDEFLTIPPGSTVKAAYNDRIVKAE
ncbi:MAG: DUF1638 domain-containing protein [Verrucomicrobiota bacterium]|nr:DUF1638 domain-containing protein [Verrucomicrobiota bacterium]